MQNTATDIGHQKHDGGAVDGEGAGQAHGEARPLPQRADLHKWSNAVSRWGVGKQGDGKQGDGKQGDGHGEQQARASVHGDKDGGRNAGADEDAPGWPGGRKHKGDRRSGKDAERKGNGKDGDAGAGCQGSADAADGRMPPPVHGGRHGHGSHRGSHGKAPCGEEGEAAAAGEPVGHERSQAEPASGGRAGSEIAIEALPARSGAQAGPAPVGAFVGELLNDVRSGIQPPAAAAADNGLNAADQPAPLAGGEADIAPVIEQIAAHVGAVRDLPGAPYLGFTMEIPHMGSIDGYVLLDGAQAHVTLQPRISGVAAFLNDQRREIEARASRRANFGIRLSVLG